ncbi:MAG: hypothetical protein J6Y37_10090 [Paludibacteraceae bacterium]|nr:hypothetical protein [Paludibacteraceae bacterium]
MVVRFCEYPKFLWKGSVWSDRKEYDNIEIDCQSTIYVNLPKSLKDYSKTIPTSVRFMREDAWNSPVAKILLIVQTAN